MYRRKGYDFDQTFFPLLLPFPFPLLFIKRPWKSPGYQKMFVGTPDFRKFVRSRNFSIRTEFLFRIVRENAFSSLFGTALRRTLSFPSYYAWREKGSFLPIFSRGERLFFPKREKKKFFLFLFSTRPSGRDSASC